MVLVNVPPETVMLVPLSSTHNPESDPVVTPLGPEWSDGIVLSATANCIYIFEGTNKRVELGDLAPGLTTRNYGIKGYDSSENILFELSNAQNFIAGWTITTATLTNSSVTLHSTGALHIINLF